MGKRLEVAATPLEGLLLVQRQPLWDPRGYFERMFCADELDEALAGRTIEQINRTVTAKRGTVRGLHFQRPPHAEIKLVSCLRGAIFDVAVDLRAGSKTLLRWHAEILSADNHRSLLIPEGFAHGFQTLTDDCELMYCHTAAFNAASEGGVHPLDPLLAIKWSEEISEISERDAKLAMLTAAFKGLS